MSILNEDKTWNRLRQKLRSWNLGFIGLRASVFSELGKILINGRLIEIIQSFNLFHFIRGFNLPLLLFSLLRCDKLRVGRFKCWVKVDIVLLLTLFRHRYYLFFRDRFSFRKNFRSSWCLGFFLLFLFKEFVK